MKNRTLELLVKRFAISFPDLKDKVEKYNVAESDEHELQIEFTDGTAAVYDYILDGCSFFESVEAMRKSAVLDDKDIWKKQVGRKLYKLSLVKHKSELDISTGAGISQSTVSRIFNGSSDISLWNFVKVARAMGLNNVEVWKVLGI